MCVHQDPPRTPVLKVEAASYHNLTLSWKWPTQSSSTNEIDDSSSSLSGFLLNFRPAASSERMSDPQMLAETVESHMNSIKLPKFQRKYVLGNLACGTRYVLHVVAFNEVGESPPSNEVQYSTRGSSKN